MELPSTYTLDTETLKLNAYRLICLFYANKEISRTSDPEQPDTGAAKLERTHFAREMTYLVLNIAIAVRVLDDQMRALAEEDPQKKAYISRRGDVDRRHNCMMFDEMSLREVCNKIPEAVQHMYYDETGHAERVFDATIELEQPIGDRAASIQSGRVGQFRTQVKIWWGEMGQWSSSAMDNLPDDYWNTEPLH